MNYYPLPPERKAPLPKWPVMLTFFCGDLLLFVRGNFGLFTLFWLFLVTCIKQMMLGTLPSFALYQYVLYCGTPLLFVWHLLHRLFSRSSRQRYPDTRFPGVTLSFLRRRSTRSNLLIVQPGILLLFIGICVLFYELYSPVIFPNTQPFIGFFDGLIAQGQQIMNAGVSTLSTEYFVVPMAHPWAVLSDRRSSEDLFFLALLHPLLSVLALFLFNAHSLTYHTEAEATAEPAPVGEIELSFPTVDSQAPSGPSSPSAQALSDDLVQE